ncbi:MAG: ATP-binding protein [Gemmatimonadales bacterium]
MGSSAELLERLAAKREDPGLELKNAMSWADHATKGKVIRAALAMANKADGGVIAFGYLQGPDQPLHDLVGLSEERWASFTQDAVTSSVNAHAVPYVDLTVEHLTVDDKRVVAIVVRQFQDYPILCGKDFVDGRPVVVRGKLYCRSRRTPESTEVQSPEDMRDIVDLAVARGLERYFRLRAIERAAEGPPAEKQFADERGDLAL